MAKKIGFINRWLIRTFLFPWVLKRKGDVLALIKDQESYRNYVVLALWNTKMGWDSINRSLIGLGLKTVKAYYMMADGKPHFFFELPSAERKAQLPSRLQILRQPNEK